MLFNRFQPLFMELLRPDDPDIAEDFAWWFVSARIAALQQALAAAPLPRRTTCCFDALNDIELDRGLQLSPAQGGACVQASTLIGHTVTAGSLHCWVPGATGLRLSVTRS